MTQLSEDKLLALAQSIDDFMTLDLTGLGVIGKLNRALKERQKGPMCLGAARLAQKNLGPGKGPALIATGFPMGAGMAETDGPVGAAMLARAFWYGLKAQSILVIDEDWEPVLRAACIGAGLTPLPLPPDGSVEEIPYLRQVYIHTVPKDENGAHQAGEWLLENAKPSLLVAVERPGRNHLGYCHGLNGRPITQWVADLDHLFVLGMKAKIPFLAVGDGGNELGMGLINGAVREIFPQATDCGCPCGGGTAVEISCDHLVTACVSNWGVSGIIAALALDMGRPDIMHDPQREVRSIELCTAAGGLDGARVAPDPSVDGIDAEEWTGLLMTLKKMVLRGLGLITDWRHA